jgi:hypothetical protein
MTNKRVLTNKNYAWFFAPATAVADINAITATEAAEFLNVTDAIKLDGTNFNTKASKSEDDRSFADGAGAKTAGNGDFGGTISGFKAQDDDTASSYHAAEVGIKPAGSDIILIARPVESASAPLAAGDEYDAWHILTDAPGDVRGSASYSWTADGLPQADMRVRGIGRGRHDRPPQGRLPGQGRHRRCEVDLERPDQGHGLGARHRRAPRHGFGEHHRHVPRRHPVHGRGHHHRLTQHRKGSPRRISRRGFSFAS